MIKSKAGKVGSVLLSTLFWLCIQVSVLFALGVLGIFPSRLFDAELHGITVYAYLIWFCIAVFAYTLIGSIILEKVMINSKRWWIIIASFYALFMILTAIGMAFTRTYFVFLLNVWLAPLLWLAEIEVFHCYLSKQREKYFQTPDDKIFG